MDLKIKKKTKFNKKVFSKAAHYTQKQKNRMLRRASQEVIMKRRYMRKAHFETTFKLCRDYTQFVTVVELATIHTQKDKCSLKFLSKFTN